MRVTNQMMANNVNAQLTRLMNQMVKTQEQITTGKRINRPSDDPSAIGSVLSYRNTISSLDQYGETIDRLQLHIDSIDDVMGMVGDLLGDAKAIAYDTDPDMRSTLAQEVADIRDQVLQMANYQIDGQYMFAGDLTNTKPYGDNSTWDYSGDGGTRDALIGENMQFSITADGREIFGPDNDNVFDILNNLETDLNTGDSDAIKSNISRLSEAIDRITHVRANNAGAYQRLEATKNHYDYFKVNVQDMLSGTEDADKAEAIINFQVQQTNYESTLASSSMILQKSLIDFLR